MAEVLVENRNKQIFKAWSSNLGGPADKNQEILYMIEHCGLGIDPDCSWRFLSICSEEQNEEGDKDAVLIYKISKKNGNIIGAELHIVSADQFKEEYSFC